MSEKDRMSQQTEKENINSQSVETEDNPVLSILVPVYNHENYIRECIESILKQKVKFKYEVLIGEDCSKDNTREILTAMKDELPDNFHIFFREKNMGIGEKGNASDLQRRAKGKYFIYLEGDDFWKYENKLQEQVDFLETHSEYIAVAHNCEVVDKNSNPIDKEFQECKEEEYTFKDFAHYILPGQSATIVYRKEYHERIKDFEPFILYDKYFSMDVKKAFLLLTLGKVKCFQEKWSAYRRVEDEGSSYTATYKYDKDTKRNQDLFYKSIFLYSKHIKNAEAIKATRKRYYFLFFTKFGRNNKLYTFKDYIKEFCESDEKILYFIFSIKEVGRFIIKKLVIKNKA